MFSITGNMRHVEIDVIIVVEVVINTVFVVVIVIIFVTCKTNSRYLNSVRTEYVAYFLSALAEFIMATNPAKHCILNEVVSERQGDADPWPLALR